MSRNRSSDMKLAGYVSTPQRQLVFETIRRSGGLLDARELYKLVNAKDANISLATVYRSLNLFKQAGLLDEHRLGRSRCCYELKQSLDHQHMLCKGCGKIFEFKSPLILELVEKIRAENEFIIEKIEVCIQGSCRDCRQKRVENV
jgi:Fur family ferric uptake transcriptional regulator